jgi:tetrahydromethanopterin S-methyltransferase subunit B
MSPALVKFSAVCGYATGGALVLAGLCIAIGVPLESDSFASGARGFADGISGAEDATRVLGQDFEESSSLLGAVSGSVLQTSVITGQTRTTLSHARDAAGDLVSACNLTADDMDGISERLAGFIAPVDLGPAAEHLRSAAVAGSMAVSSMDSLGLRLAELQEMLADVASSIDSLGSDLAATRGTMEDAGSRLESVRQLAGRMSSSSFVAVAGICVGLGLVLLGLQQMVLSTLLLRLKPGQEPSKAPCPEEGRGQS